MNNTLFLNFFADSVKWENLILCPAYPVGMSFFRGFRYRDKWIHQTLLQKIKEDSFDDYSSAIIGASFLGKDKIDKILPIRKVDYLFLKEDFDNYYVYFKFGEMVDFSQQDNLENLVLTIPEFNDIQNRDDAYLFFDSKVSLENIDFTDGSDERERASWTKYVELLCNEQNLSIKDEAKNSIYLRISEVGSNEKLITSKIEGEKFGMMVSEGKINEICVHHRVPCLLDQHLHLPNLGYEYHSSSDNVHLSSQHEVYSGNYDIHNLILTGLSRTKSYSTIHIKCKQEFIKVNDIVLYTHDLNIPVKVKLNFCYRLKNQYFNAIIFGLGILLTQFQIVINLLELYWPDFYKILNLGSLSGDEIGVIGLIGTIISTIAFALYKGNL